MFTSNRLLKLFPSRLMSTLSTPTLSASLSTTPRPPSPAFKKRPKFNNLLVDLPTHQPFKLKQQTHSIHITTTKNNSFVTLTLNGNVIKSKSSGTIGLRKSNRKTSDAGYQTTTELLKETSESVLKNGVVVYFKGFGKGRDSCWRALRAMNVNVKRVVDCTPVRHGGCRPKKKRRI